LAAAGPGRRKPRPHHGRFIPERPNLRWARMRPWPGPGQTGWGGWCCVDHDTAQAWAQVAKIGDRFAALQPVDDAVVDRWGRLDAEWPAGWRCATTGPQDRSARFAGSLAWLGSSDDPAFWVSRRPTAAPSAGPGPQGPGLWVQRHDPTDELCQAVAGFVDRSNPSWLIQRHGHLTAEGGLPGSTAAPAA
jgi:hypothetical protein